MACDTNPCDVCTDVAKMGAPPCYMVSISGVQNNGCLTCGGVNGEYTLEYQASCNYQYFEDNGPCDWGFIIDLTITEKPDCQVEAEASIWGTPDAIYRKQMDVADLLQDFTLPLVQSRTAECTNWPSELTFRPVLPSLSNANNANCFNTSGCPSEPVPVKPVRPSEGLVFPVKCCPCPSAGLDSGHIPAPNLTGCGTNSCTPRPFPPTGNLSLPVQTPAGSPASPVIDLTYNSTPRLNQDSANGMGYGIGSINDQRVEEVTATSARVYHCDGSSWMFVCFDSTTGVYRAVGNNPNTLKKEASWLEGDPEGNQFHYNDNGYLDWVADPDGNRWTLIRDANDGLQYIIDPNTARTTFAYDGSGNIQRIQDSYGRITSLTVDQHGNLTRFTSPELCVTDLIYGSGYDNAHLLMASVAPDGSRTSYSYDGNDWLSGIHYPNGGRYTYNYLSWGETRVTDPEGRITTLMYNLRRNVTGVIDPLGNRTTFLWNNDRKVGEISPTGVRTTFIYNSDGFVQASEVAGERTTTLFDTGGDVLATVDPLNHRTTYVRDTSGRVTARENPLGNRTSFTYNSSGQQLSVIDPLGRRTTTVYNAAGEAVAGIDASGNRTSYTYQNGQQITVKNPLGNVSTTLYNQTNQILARINPLGARTTLLYDSGGRQHAQIDPLGNRTTTVFGNGGERTASISPLGYRTSFTYNKSGQVIRTTSPVGAINTTVYDQAARPVAAIDPLGRRSTTVYNASSRVIASVNPLGERNTTVYNATRSSGGERQPSRQPHHQCLRCRRTHCCQHRCPRQSQHHGL